MIQKYFIEWTSVDLKKMIINELEVTVEKKNIKNMHLYVKPPNGEIRVTAPKRMSDDVIKDFVTSKITWINKHRQKLLQQPQQMPLEYVTGESVYIWGRKMLLEVIYTDRINAIILEEHSIIMRVRAVSTPKQRENYLNEWYRKQLTTHILPIAEKYEQIMGVHASEWRTKNMQTRWGTCNTGAKRIWLNLNLAKKHPDFLEYVIVHELCHLLEPSHNQVFKGYMDQFLPDWRNIKQAL